MTMYVGRPVTAACRIDGLSSRGLLSPGTIDIIPLGAPSAWVEDGPSSVICIHLSATFIHETAEAMGLNPDSVSITPQVQLRDRKLEHIGWAFKAELESGEVRDRLYAEGLGTALAVHLLRGYSRTRSLAPKYGLTPRQLRDVTDYIKDHLSFNLSLAELAAVAGVSASHFKHLFKQNTGLPVHQYVIRQRVDRAVHLIASSRLKLSEAALQAGFADQSHMARCMRRTIGMTPNAVVRISH